VFTDASGASRVYFCGEVRFVSANDGEAIDSHGQRYQITGAALLPVPAGSKLPALKRAPAHRAFWFGWHAAHPGTRLVNPPPTGE